MAAEKLNWVSVDPSTLPEALKPKFAALQKAQKAEREARKEFEAAFISASNKVKKIPAGQTLAFSYKYGTLGIATKAEAKTEKSKNGGTSWF